MSTRFLTALPVYNEESHVQAVLAEVRRYAPNILVVNNGCNSVSVLGKDGMVFNTLKVGISPYGVAVTPSGIWVTNAGSNSISKR